MRRSRRLATLWRRRAEERGQMAWAMTLTLLLVFTLFAVSFDVGIWVFDHRVAQNQADSAALAAVLELPSNNTNAAEDAADDYLVRNGSNVSERSCLEFTDENGDGLYDTVRVCVERDAPGVFAALSGIASVNISASATAAVFEGEGAYAIFVSNNSCGDDDALEFSGSNISVTGATHSNAHAKVNGSNNSFNGDFTYRCGWDNSGSGNTYSSFPTPTTSQDPPIEYEYDDFSCTREFTSDTDLTSVNNVWVGNNPDSGQLKPGVYCSTEKLSLSSQGVSGNVTLVAKSKLNINGSDFDLEGFADLGDGPVLAFSSADPDETDPAIDMSGSNGTWSGYIHAPVGRVTIGGSDDSNPQELIGSIVAYRINVSGSGFNISAEGFGGGPNYIALIK